MAAILSTTTCVGCEGHGAGSAGANEKPQTVTVFAASSTKDVVESLAAEFEKSATAKVQISLGPSNQLATQIIEGAPADIFISASAEWADKLAGLGLISKDVRFVGNRLVIVVPREQPAAVRSPQDLTSADVARVALAGEEVPAGKYAEQALRTLGLMGTLAASGKIVRGGDVRITLSYVELGEVDAGIVYATDARASTKVDVAFVFDERAHDPIRYPIVLLKRGEATEAARRFYELLNSTEARRAFEAAGFSVITGG